MPYSSRQSSHFKIYELALVVAGIYYAGFLFIYHYLPSPFFYDKYDSFMDFFNVLYWANDEGRYSEWQSIYMPFAFVLAKIIGVLSGEGGLASSLPYELRSKSIDGVLIVFIIIILLLLIIDKKRFRNDSKAKLYWIYFSLPFLFAFERGNLILVTYLFLLLAFVYNRKTFAYSFFLALAISLKFYLVALLFVPFIMNQQVKVFLTIFFVLLINSFSAMLISSTDWLHFFSNMFAFSSDPKYFEWAYFSYSFRNLLLGLAQHNPSLQDTIDIIDFIAITLSFVLYAFVTLKFLNMTRPNKYKNVGYMYLLLLMLIMIVVNNAGGYAFLLLFPFINFMTQTRWQRFLIFLMVLPLAIDLYVLDQVQLVKVYWDSTVIDIARDVTLGMVLRPIAFMLLYVFVSIKFLNMKFINCADAKFV